MNKTPYQNIITIFILIVYLFSTYAQIAEAYKQTAQVDRDAAAKAKCIEKRNALIKLAEYNFCLKRFLLTGGKASCTDPTTRISGCVADAGSASKKDPYGSSLVNFTRAPNPTKNVGNNNITLQSNGATNNSNPVISSLLNSLDQLFTSYKIAGEQGSTDLFASEIISIIGGLLQKDAGTQQEMQNQQVSCLDNSIRTM